MIAKEDFEAYEAVRVSGVTNMFAITTVCELSKLNKEQVIDIMQNYEKYKEQWIQETNN